MNAEIISSIDFSEYDEFVKKSNFSTFFHSKNHIKFLESILGIKASFATVRENKELVGIMPFFEKKGEFGSIINSLPFFGSYGGPISNETKIDEKLLEKMNLVNKENDVLSSVIIDNPFYNKTDTFRKKFVFQVEENKMIQCTNLKNKSSDQIWANFEKRVRWSVRKGEKNGINIQIENENESHLKKIYELHENSMKMKGGRPKPKNLFSIILKNFESGKDYDILIATKNNNPIAYVLVFYYKNFAEYYLPVYDPEYFSLQPTSYLIWQSIKKSIENNIEYYNFGGTWKNQKELYLFKRGWDADDLYYNYYIFRDIEKIREIGIENIAKKYEYFYISPFDEIKN